MNRGNQIPRASFNPKSSDEFVDMEVETIPLSLDGDESKLKGARNGQARKWRHLAMKAIFGVSIVFFCSVFVRKNEIFRKKGEKRSTVEQHEIVSKVYDYIETDKIESETDKEDIATEKKSMETDKEHIETEKKDIETDKENINTVENDIETDHKDIKNNEKDIEIDKNDIKPSLKLAWLMSFPNSGTSYTLRLVREASQLETASNYCDSNGYYVPVYGKDIPGPHLIARRKNAKFTVPDSYILTKTHCSSRCGSCPPSEYLTTESEFREECLKECYDFPNEKHRTYDGDLVKKAIHLFRDPFDNIISRFHLHLKHIKIGEANEKPGTYSNDPDGFLEYCRDQDSMFSDEEETMFSEKALKLAKDVPCHADFYRFVQWHNLAFATTRKMAIETHILHYEDYHPDTFEKTLSNILNFLEMPFAGGHWEYHASDYSAYYTDQQRTKIKAFVNEIASTETLEQLARYGFDSNDGDVKPVNSGKNQDLKVAWLMSFPNSGTSYTMSLVRVATQMDTATNYCAPNGFYQPIYDENMAAPHLSKKGDGVHFTMPTKYILTKTHCGSRCESCPPTEYITTEKQFRQDCLQECYGFPKQNHRIYGEDLVAKAIHLFRDPFDNIISRFHLHMHHSDNGRTEDEPGTYTYAPEGFQKYCKDLDHRYAEEDKIAFSSDLNALAKGVPCHSDFYRYVQWHNLAFETTRKMGVPTHILHYEDYHLDKFNATLTGILDFLEMPLAGKIMEYHASEYSAYYTQAQRNATKEFVRKIASADTLKELARYAFKN